MIITTNRQSEEVTHTLRYSFGGASGTIAENVTDTATWTPPLLLASQIPSATTGLCTILCDSYIGSNMIGTTQKMLTLTIPDTVVPTISAVTISEASAGIAEKFGAYIRTHSALTTKISASGTQGSTISSYRSVLNSVTYTGDTFRSGFLNVAGENQMTVTVTDSRGRIATAIKKFVVVDYSTPSLTTFTAERCNTDGSAAQLDGDKVRVGIVATASACDGKNLLTGKIYYRVRGDTDWIEAQELTFVGYAISEGQLLLGQTFNPLSSYDLKVSITDYFTTVEQTISIGTKRVLIDFYRDGSGIAFGKSAERPNEVDFGWPIVLAEPLALEYGGTGGATSADACKNIGAVNKEGDTMTGSLKIEGASEPGFYLIPTSTNRTFRASMQGTSTGVIKITAWENADGKNRRALVISTAKKESTKDNALIMQCIENDVYTSHRVFHEGMETAIPIKNGGTGAVTAEAAKENLGIGNASELTSGTVPMARLPYKMACGTIEAAGSDVEIDYSTAGFTKIPCVTVTYATTEENWNGGGGTLKVHTKTLTGAKVTVGGFDGTRTADWIAIGE